MKNKILIGAIGTVLSLQISSVLAGITDLEHKYAVDLSLYDSSGTVSGVYLWNDGTTGNKIFTLDMSGMTPYNDGVITYASEIFSDTTMVLPGGCVTGEEIYSAVTYKTSVNKLPNTTTVTYTLEGAQFDDAQLGILDNDVSDNGADTPGPFQGTGLSPIDGKINGNIVKFTIDTTGAENTNGVNINELGAGTEFLLLYRLSDVSTLATAGNSISMTIDVSSDFSDSLVIAKSKQAWEFDLSPTIDNTTRISVSGGSIEFIDVDDSEGEAWVNTDTETDTQANIGTLRITKNDEVYSCDEVEDLAVGGTTTTALKPLTLGEGYGALADDSQLQITGGQFSAADGLTLDSATSTNIVEATIENILTTDGIATIDLPAGFVVDDYDIILNVDGNTVINVPENEPTVSLTLNFDKMESIIIDSTVLKIRKDGLVCRILNVPSQGLLDNFNLRLTNISGQAGTLSAVLYDTDGNTIGSGLLAPTGTADVSAWELEPGETMYLNTASLEELFGTTWTGRAMMEISTTIKDVEALVLLRNAVPGSPLTNLSLGAQGSSCF